MLTYSFSRFARICLMRPSRCPAWVFGTKSFRIVLVTLGCSLLEASLSRGSLANNENFKSETAYNKKKSPKWETCFDTGLTFYSLKRVVEGVPDESL